MSDINHDTHLEEVYRFALEILRPQTVKTVIPSDATLDYLKNEVQTELGRIYAVLPGLAGSIKRGLVHLDEHEHSEANLCFRQAEQSATAHLSSSPSFKQKLWSVRILLISTFYIDGFFSEFCDFESLVRTAEAIFDGLVELPEVQSALHDELNPRSVFQMTFGSGSKHGRRKLLSAVGYIHTAICKATNKDFAIKRAEGSLYEKISILKGARDEHLSSFTLGERYTEVNALLVHQNKVYVGTSNGTIEVRDAVSSAVFHNVKAHDEPVYALTISGDKLFSAAGDKTVRMWELSTLAEVHSFEGHTDAVFSVAVHGNRLFSGSSDKTVKVWDIIKKTEITTLENHDDAVLCLAVGDNKLFTGGRDSKINVYDVNSLGIMNTLTLDTAISSLAVNKELLFAGGQTMVHVWDIVTLEKVTQLVGHRLRVRGLVVTSGRLYSVSEDRNCIVWDLTTMVKSEGEDAQQANFQAHTKAVHTVAVSDGRLYTAGEDTTVKVWDLNPWAEEGN